MSLTLFSIITSSLLHFTAAKSSAMSIAALKFFRQSFPFSHLKNFLHVRTLRLTFRFFSAASPSKIFSAPKVNPQKFTSVCVKGFTKSILTAPPPLTIFSSEPFSSPTNFYSWSIFTPRVSSKVTLESHSDFTQGNFSASQVFTQVSIKALSFFCLSTFQPVIFFSNVADCFHQFFSKVTLNAY